MTDCPQFQMPAEWEPHEATWIGWPTNPEDWPGKLPAVEWVFVEMVRHLAPHEHVHILIGDAEAEESARAKLDMAGVEHEAVSFHLLETNRNWLRDAGAIFTRNRASGELKAMHFKFNAWAKYDNYHLDQTIPETMERVAGVAREKALIAGSAKTDWMVLEGGAIDVNGAGILMTTEECLLSDVQARNPDFTREEIESALKSNLGVQTILWLNKGIAGDDTHGHVDDAARFVSERTVIAMEEKNKDDENHEILAENLEILRSYRDAKGALDVVPIPMPAPTVFDGLLVPASYANFYIANETVLVPTFNDPNDRIALGILQELFPSRVVRGIHAVDLVWGLGTLHCLTQQQPK